MEADNSEVSLVTIQVSHRSCGAVACFRSSVTERPRLTDTLASHALWAVRQPQPPGRETRGLCLSQPSSEHTSLLLTFMGQE